MNINNNIICKHCGKLFVKTRNRVFCSNKCTKEYFRLKCKNYYNPINKSKLLKERENNPTYCKYCGIGIITNLQNVYCSNKCRKEASNILRKNRKKEKTKNKDNKYKNKYLITVCKVCGKLIKNKYNLKMHWYRPKNYCSRDCIRKKHYKILGKKYGKPLDERYCQTCNKLLEKRQKIYCKKCSSFHINLKRKAYYENNIGKAREASSLKKRFGFSTNCYSLEFRKQMALLRISKKCLKDKINKADSLKLIERVENGETYRAYE